MKDEIAQTIESFIRENFWIPEDDDVFSRTVNLWEEGYVDSTGVVEVVAFLQSTFEVTVPEEALFDPAFTHIDGIAGWIVKLQAKS
ncbi:MAG: acyl carrier protein [Myxococcota bacterium]